MEAVQAKDWLNAYETQTVRQGGSDREAILAISEGRFVTVPEKGSGTIWNPEDESIAILLTHLVEQGVGKILVRLTGNNFAVIGKLIAVWSDEGELVQKNFGTPYGFLYQLPVARGRTLDLSSLALYDSIGNTTYLAGEPTIAADILTNGRIAAICQGGDIRIFDAPVVKLEE